MTTLKGNTYYEYLLETWLGFSKEMIMSEKIEPPGSSSLLILKLNIAGDVQ